MPEGESAVVSAVEAVESGQNLTFESKIRPASYLGLSLKNGLLNIVTLTLYRFWGKTEVRRRVWSETTLNGEPFEYTGRGIELFVGFLLATLFIGLPFLAVVLGAQFLGPVVAALVILPLYLFMGWLWGFGVFTAFRYMASRTSWRGVRFRLTGGAAGYGGLNLLMVILSVLTLGWAWPWAERKLAEPLWGGLRYGDKPLSFLMGRSEQEGVYGAYAIGWCGTVGLYFVLMFGFIGVIFASAMAAGGEVPQEPGLGQILSLYGMMLVLAPLYVLVWSPYWAAMARSVAAGVALDDVRFSLDVRAMPMAGLVIVNGLLLIVSLGLLTPLVQARTARFLVERLKAHGAVDLSTVTQTDRGPKSGEGLADAFGFGSI